MIFIESTLVSELCDYSFGDQASYIHNLYNKNMKEASIDNKEFITLYENYKSAHKKVMFLFIDNIRLYKRNINVSNPDDKKWIDNLFVNNDLLQLCSILSDMKFVIFTGHEDTPIDEYIEGKIPDNVLGIYAVNAIYSNDKIFPLPYGLQRKLAENDFRYALLMNINNGHVVPDQLLYVNHSINTNINKRSGINELFYNKSWASVETVRLAPTDFYKKIKRHKFMICPEGNAIDCHRNWEVLYLHRVPIMKHDEYLHKLFDGLPVLFVNEYSDITEQLLLNNMQLYDRAQTYDMEKMDLETLFNNIKTKYFAKNET